jgi:hypothetical protein
MSRAALSKAERSLHGSPIRRFDADEILALARIFDKQVGDFFIPPEPHFHGRRVIINGKPGDRKARVTSKPINRDETIDLAFRVLTQPRTEAERLRLEAGSEAVIVRLLELQAKAMERAIRGHLNDHPQALAPLLVGDPTVVSRFREATMRAGLGVDTAPREKKLADELATLSNEGRERSRRDRSRNKR